MFVAYVAGAGSRARGLLGGLACTLGIMVSFVVYFAIASFVGTFFIAHYTAFVTVVGILIIFLGIAMITPLRRLFYRVTPRAIGSKVEGELGAFVVGAAYSFIAAPCAAPLVLSAFLSIFATATDFLIAAVSALLFGLGAGIPFIVVGVFFERAARSQKLLWLVSRSHYLSGILLVTLGTLLVLGIL